jgi:hypothetical protein
LIETCIAGNLDKDCIRPTVWKLLLNIFNPNGSISNWLSTTLKQRAEFKLKQKSLVGLKKFSGDPLGGNAEVNLLY